MRNHFITTKRLGLDLLKKEDIEYLEQLEADVEVKRFFPSGPRDRDRTLEMINRFMANYEQKGLPCFMIFALNSGDFIGRIGFGPTEDGEIEVGYVLEQKYWGKGYAAEALAAVLQWAQEHIDADQIIAYAVLANLGSFRVMEKCGMTYYKTGIAQGDTCKFYRIKNR